MPKHRPQSNSPIERLRLAIDCLPVRTREAMLEGVCNSERIIAGAYVDGKGGVCPMLAAHRRGARTGFLSFAKSWDRFARASGGARLATPRERAILISQLEASLMSNSGGLELDVAIAEHRKLRGARIRRRLAPFEGADPRGVIRVRRVRRSLARAADEDEALASAEARARASLPV
jgi:hypothetical protein